MDRPLSTRNFGIPGYWGGYPLVPCWSEKSQPGMKAKYFGLEELHISLGGMQESAVVATRGWVLEPVRRIRSFSPPEIFLDGTPPKIGGLGRFVSFSKGSFSASNLLGNSWVYNLGDDQQISFWLHHCISRVFFLIRHELGMPSCWRPCWFLMIFVSRNRCHDQLPNHLQVHFVVWRVARVIDPWKEEDGCSTVLPLFSLNPDGAMPIKWLVSHWLVLRNSQVPVKKIAFEKNWTMPERETVSLGCQRAILSIYTCFYFFTPVLDHASPNLN